MGLDDTELHITIVTEQARVVVARRGVYRINALADSTELLVRKGRALINDNPRNFIKGGNEVVFRGGSFLANKLGKKQQDQFDDWSKERANTLAKANEKLSARGLNTYLASVDYWDWAFSAANPYGIWAFSPFSRCFTFLPFYDGWASPYGHNYFLYYDRYDRYDYWLRRGGCCGGVFGRQPVIVTRDRRGQINVLLNRCRHRGASLCETPRGNGNGSGSPASSVTVKSWPRKSLNDRIRDRNRIVLLSCFQPMTMLFGPMRSDTSSRLSVAVNVSRRGTPPSAGMT